MLHVETKVCLAIEGPLLTKSTAPGKYGLDVVAARNIDGIAYIPGTHVIGKARQALEEMHGLIDAKSGDVDWFDPEIKNELLGIGEDSGRDPLPKAIHVSDFLLKTGSPAEGCRTRIKIDHERKAVEKGAQLVIDEPFKTGRFFYFEGIITFLVESRERLDSYLLHLEAALKWTGQMGAFRSIGFGRLKDVEVGRPAVKTYECPAQWPGRKKIDLILKPLYPFCVSKKRIADNLFESETIIPGGVIKGCIAETWRRIKGMGGGGRQGGIADDERQELADCFSAMRISHAFPSADCLKRPVVPPLSLVKVDAESCRPYYDVALCSKPCLIGGRVPAFRIDWKDHGDVMRDCGWPEIRKEMRVRTAIDRRFLTAGDSELFAYEMTVPDENYWMASISLPEMCGKESGPQLASLLKHGILGLGKTKIPVDITMLPAGSVKKRWTSNPAPRDGLWVITLQTPAILADPHLSRNDLLGAYAEAWNELSNGSLRLIRCFARQRLAGGEYLFRRFQKDGKKAYYPWLLTVEGSVFVLEPEDEKQEEAGDKISNWLENGLELPLWAKKRYAVSKSGESLEGDHWRANPFIATNGYGEIAVNLDVHWECYPPDDIREDIDGIGKEGQDGR